jgi:hypothetical protein
VAQRRRANRRRGAKSRQQGTVRVEAKLEGDCLVASWHMLTADGAEVFRGQWKAERAKETSDQPKP